jgi:hypothetical protein
VPDHDSDPMVCVVLCAADAVKDSDNVLVGAVRVCVTGIAVTVMQQGLRIHTKRSMKVGIVHSRVLYDSVCSTEP